MASTSKKSPPQRVPTSGARVTRGRAAADRTHWQVNWWLLAATAAVFAVLLPAGYFWHAYQLKRHGTIFLSRARVSESDEQWNDAVLLIQRYLAIYPEDLEARVRLAKVYDHAADEAPAKIPAAERLFSIAVGLMPKQADLRVKHARRLMDLGRCTEALAEAQEALKITPDDSEALQWKALAGFGDARMRGDFSAGQTLVADFTAAIAAAAGTTAQMDLAIQLAEIYRHALTEPTENERRRLADEVVDKMVAENAARPGAWVLRYLYHLRNDGTAQDSDLDHALELDPQHLDAILQLTAADRDVAQKNPTAARERYQYVIAAHPDNARAYLGLARLQQSGKEHAETIATLERGVKAVGVNDQVSLQLALVSAYLSAGELDQADLAMTEAGSQLEQTERRVNRATSSRLRMELDSLRATWHIEKRQFPQAIATLRRVLSDSPRAVTKEDVARRAQLWMQLGYSYAALRHWDQAAMAFQEATALQPQVIAPQFAAAKAWQSAGRLDEAVREFRRAALRPDATEEVWAALVEAEIRQQVTNPAKSRDWGTVESNIREAQKRFPQSETVAALGMQVSDLVHGTHQAFTVMEKALADAPSNPAIAEQLMLAYEATGEPEKANEVLARFGKESSDATDVLLLRAALLLARNKNGEAKELLAEALRNAADTRQDKILFVLANVAMRMDDLEEATRILTELASRADRSEELLEMLADLALETRDLDKLVHWENELRQQEGSDGTLWRFYRAQRFINDTGDNVAARLADADTLAAEIIRSRPMWTMGKVVQGQIAQKRGQTERAIEAYRGAIQLGETRTFVREQLAVLLFTTGAIDELQEFLTELGDAVNRSQRLANIAISTRIRNGNSTDALQLARQQVERRPIDALSHVALGQALIAAGKTSEAAAAFRQATVVAPSDVKAWQALFGFWITENNPAEAQKTLEELAKAVDISERDLLPLMAQDQLLLGNESAAVEAFHKLLKLAPDDVAVLRTAGRFFVSRDPAVAEDCLRRAVQLRPDESLPHLDLAAFLIDRGDDKQLAEAAQLLGSSIHTKADPRGQQLMARLCLRRGEAGDHQRGIDILQELVGRGEGTDEDRLLLIELCQREGKSQEAQEQAFVLASRKRAEPRHIARYVELLLRDGRSIEAGTWLEKLAAVDPDNFTTLSLRVRYLGANNRQAEIESLAEAFLQRALDNAKSDPDKTRILRAVGNLYAQANLDTAAERTLRKALAQDPNEYPALALWLAGHARTSEAVELCERAAAADDSARAATVLAQALTLARPDAELAKRADPIFEKALGRHGQDADLLLTLATLRLVEERDAEGITLLRRLVAADRRNAMAANNLANALGENSETRQEALQLVDQAINQAGPLPELLDTKGTLLLFSGDTEGAIRVLQDATRRSTADPRHLFHLALALERTGKAAESREALARARKRSLDTAVLSPKHRRLLADLERELDRKAG
jgi:tetratricopeptide (TPR) repeat protein